MPSALRMVFFVGVRHALPGNGPRHVSRVSTACRQAEICCSLSVCFGGLSRLHATISRETAMSSSSGTTEIGLDVISPDGSHRFVRITETPFYIGRSSQSEKHLQLIDSRISRQCAVIKAEEDRYVLEDCGQRHGLFVNGTKISRRPLDDGDVITFGVKDFYELIFRSVNESDTSIPEIISRFENITATDGSTGGLHKLNLLLEATALLHSRLPLESVLGNMLDHAITVTDADRGLLFEAKPGGSLTARLARASGARPLATDNIAASQTALRLAVVQQSPIITGDLAQAQSDLQEAISVIQQRLRSVVAIPLYSMHHGTPSTTESMIRSQRSDLLGLIYLDSQRPAAFTNLERRILDALAMEAASILENARLVERDRERRRLEQEISIARDIQQALLPRTFADYPHMAVAGMNLPCLSVGGDYFDVFPMGNDRIAFLIADVAGKGLGAALLATMLQGALFGLKIGADPALVFDHLNSFLCDHIELGRFATVFFGVLDREGQIDFINAGHPSPFLVRPGYIAEPFTECCFPVGMMPGAEYKVTRMKLQPEDTLILFSDGLTEAMNPTQQLYGTARVKDLLLGQHNVALTELQKAVLASVNTFVDTAPQADDITLLFIRYRAPVN